MSKSHKSTSQKSKQARKDKAFAKAFVGLPLAATPERKPLVR